MRAIIVALVALLSVSSPASAHHVRHYHHHVRHHHGAVKPAQPAPQPPSLLSRLFGGGSSLISAMRSHLGTNPTGWAHNWCGRFLSTMLHETGHAAGSDKAAAYRSYGRPSAGPCVGCIAVWPHHVGVVTGIPAAGKITLLSGNDGHRVRERDVSARGAVFRQP